MKHLFTSLLFLWVTICFSQSDEVNSQLTSNNMKISGLSISVSVDSAEEIESTFNIKNIQEILDKIDENEEVTFEIICNGDKMSNDVKSKLSYSINGNTNDIDGFIRSVRKIRNAAIKYYKNKE